jgi:integrase/recombinase XerD
MDENTALTPSIPRPSAGPLLVDPDTTDETLIALWLRGKSKETVRAYRVDLAAFRRFVDGKPLRQITLNDLYGFSDSLKALDEATTSRRMSSLKSLLSFAATVRYLPFNVGAAYRLPKLDDALAERILTEEQVQKMLALETRPRNHALLRLLYGAGLRVSEVVALTWDHIHEREGNRAQLTIHGKGEKTRHVLISAATWEELKTLQGETPPGAPVFISRGGGRVNNKGGALTDRQVRVIVRNAAQRAGIAKDVSPHWLRHAHASHAQDRGAPPHLVMRTLGHGSLAITGRYTHVRPRASSSEYLPV